MTDQHHPNVLHWRYTKPGTYRERLTRRQLRDVLLYSPDPIIRGRLWRWASKHLGAGVYELWVEPPR